MIVARAANTGDPVMLDPLDGFINTRDEFADAPPPPPQRRPVANPRLPADAGLSVLGVLMQTAGGALALLALVMGIAGMITVRSPIALVFALLCAVRSGLQMQAGTQLALHGVGAARKLWTYIGASVVQTGLMVALLAVWVDTVEPMALGLLAALLLVWPVVLVVLTRRPDFAAALRMTDEAESDRLLPEDRGMTALGLLMLAGGAVVLPMMLAMIAAFVMQLAAGGFAALIGMGVVGLFALRAGYGGYAGFVAMRSRDPHRLHEAFERYQKAATASAVFAGLFWLVVALFAGGAGLLSFVIVLPVLFALHAWPRALRMYFERNLPEGTYSEERLPILRRPRDAGLTGLGAVLLASGAVWLVSSITGLVLSTDDVPVMFAAALSEAHWTGPVSSAVTLVAGWCLFTMNRFYRLAAVGYGAIGGALAVFGVIQTAAVFDEVGMMGQQWVGLMVMQLCVALVLPLLTLWVGLRHEEVGDEVADQELVTAFD